MATFTITTLGCKVNQHESEVITEALKNFGWILGGRHPAVADVCIINTCTVTRKAAMQSRQAVRQAIKAHPGARIIVTGCYAQTEPEALQKIAGVGCVAGNAAKFDLADMLAAAPDDMESLAARGGFDLSSASPFKGSFAAAGRSRTRPFLKIQDGCNALCTYCIIPYARGRSRSMPYQDVIKNIRGLARAGFHEVVLCGIHLGSYGLDLASPAGLIDILKQAESGALIDRLRLSSIEPREISDDIIALTAASEHICPHFHIPLQSGDDGILARMHRPYSRDFFRELILKIRAAMPDAAIGLDVLVGFPGETEAAFQNTFRLIQELPVTYLHVFPFSPREGTPACSFPEKVPAAVIQARCQILRQLGVAKKKSFYRQFIGPTLPVLIEGRRDAAGRLKGFSANYLPVCVSGPDNLKNTVAAVRIASMGQGPILHGVLSSDKAPRDLR